MSVVTRIDVAAGITLVITRLNAGNIPYMIVGSIAGAVYGEPRLTRDIDLVLHTLNLQAKTILDAFSEEDFYIPPREVISQELSRRGQINLLHHASGLKVDCLFIKSTPHAQAEFSRRKILEMLPGVFAWVASAEDIIIKKLEYYREGRSEKHLTDIRGIIANSPLDQPYLDEWIATLKLEDEWRLCQ